MTTAFAGWMVGHADAVQDHDRPVAPPASAQEFIYIICAVVGGCLLTGGYGSAIGAALGALIYGMVGQGIVYAGLGQRLAVRVPRRDAPRRRPRQQLGQVASGESAMSTQSEPETTGGRQATGGVGGPTLPPPGTAIIEVTDIGKTYGSRHRPA